MMTDTTAVYMRVSTREQDVASQRRQIDQWLEVNGLTVADHRWYVDHGFSGKNLTRPHFMSLQSAIRHEQVRTVVVYALDRLARNALEGLNVLHEWLKKGVRLVAVREQFDFSGDVGQLIASVLWHVAQMERTIMRERQLAGVAAIRERQRQAHELAGQGKSVDEIAGLLRIKSDKVKRMLAAPPGKLWWGSKAKRGAENNCYRKEASHDRVLELMRKGLSDDEVARALGISERTFFRRLRAMGGARTVRSMVRSDEG